jgi:hypothetical protein
MMVDAASKRRIGPDYSRQRADQAVVCYEGKQADPGGANPENDYIRGFLEGVATCVQGIFVGPVQTVQQIGAHAGYYWEIGAALWRGDRETAARILGIKTEEDRRNFEAVYNPDVRNASPRQAGYRQGSRLCQFGVIRGINKARAEGPIRPSPSGGGEPPLLPGTGSPQTKPNLPSPVGPMEKPSLPSGPITALPHLPPDPSKTQVPSQVAPSAQGPSTASFKGIRPDTVRQYPFPPGAASWTPERIGEVGMEAEAKARGYWPLLTWEDAGTTPQGFDAVYWDPKTGALVIGEAKGGYSGASLEDLLAKGYQARQGTIAWAEKAAQRVTRALRTNDKEVRYAEQVARAIRDRTAPVRVEVFHTEINQGKPGVTRHYVSDSLP